MLLIMVVERRLWLLGGCRKLSAGSNRSKAVRRRMWANERKGIIY